MHASIRASMSDRPDSLNRQGSIRRVLPSDHNKESYLDRKKDEVNKMNKFYKQEYIILAEYKMIQNENIPGVYVIPSRENPFIWFGVVFVRSGPYENGIFRFNILLDDDFPDCNHPKVIFNSQLFHPVVYNQTRELNLQGAFPTWKKDEQHMWQVLKYIQWMFYNIEESLSHAVNTEAVDFYKLNRDAFSRRVQENVKLSNDRLYDEPPTEDKHYICFSQYDADAHVKIKRKMLNYKPNDYREAKGHSWVLPGSFVPLSRSGSPPSESEES